MDNDILNKYLDRYNSDFVDFEIDDENDNNV
jgi:hypothetical protein